MSDPINPPPVAGGDSEKNKPETSPGQIQKNMEVHHHGHVQEKKKWKEYIFQFFMLLLAVFLGSYAETKREEIVEKHREKDYMESMIDDVKKDTSIVRQNYSFIFTQIQKIDSLQMLFQQNLNNNPHGVFKCYEFSYYLKWYSAVSFNERTMSQLISSGNMRIIRRNGAADSIMDYYNAIKTIDLQKQQYINYINSSLAAMYNVFDVTYLRQELSKADSTLQWTNDWSDLHLLTTDPAALKKLSSTLESAKFVIHNYMVQLGLVVQKAEKLISFLKKEYAIESQ